MVDITERKQAEQALQASERKYSEAFRREREAAQQLRALDDMKNTFLEAVSHDLRTPLTSILGSAITLERANMDLPQEDAVDLVRRIATNARKLERLLGDLLDLDRLQRGIVSPQRRQTDVGELIRRAVDETEERNGREWPLRSSVSSTARRISSPTSVWRRCGDTIPRWRRSRSSRSPNNRSSLRALVAMRRTRSTASSWGKSMLARSNVIADPRIDVSGVRRSCETASRNVFFMSSSALSCCAASRS